MTNAIAVFQAAPESSSDLTTYTFSSQPLGPANSSRYNLIAVNGNISSGTPSISSVTIGGTSAAVVSDGVADASVAASGRISALWIAAKSTGETGDVVVTFGAGMQDCSIGIWALYNIDSATATDTQIRTVISASVDFPSLATVDNGCAIFTIGGKTQLSTYTWSNSTERYDDTTVSPISHTGADMETDGTSVSETATASNASTLSTGACASFAPAAGATDAAQLVSSGALVG